MLRVFSLSFIHFAPRCDAEITNQNYLSNKRWERKATKWDTGLFNLSWTNLFDMKLSRIILLFPKFKTLNQNELAIEPFDFKLKSFILGFLVIIITIFLICDFKRGFSITVSCVFRYQTHIISLQLNDKSTRRIFFF